MVKTVGVVVIHRPSAVGNGIFKGYIAQNIVGVYNIFALHSAAFTLAGQESQKVEVVGFAVFVVSGIFNVIPCAQRQAYKLIAQLFGVAVVVLGVLLGITYGPQPALYAEMFPASVRLSGVSISYAIGSIIGGAFAPMIAELLFSATGTSLSIGVYIGVISLLSLIAVMAVPAGIQRRNLSE